jgi:hypothetical protein
MDEARLQQIEGELAGAGAAEAAAVAFAALARLGDLDRSSADELADRMAAAGEFAPAFLERRVAGLEFVVEAAMRVVRTR